MSADGSARIDLNADLGEGLDPWHHGVPGPDAALLDVVTSANVACGFHAGGPQIMARTCAAAVERGVSIGAHVGYHDLEGFGRRAREIPADVLRAEIAYQIGALVAVARAAGGRVAYVKPHGALYNAIVHHEVQAEAVVAAVLAVDDSLPIVGLPGSVVLALARDSGLRAVGEAFADRGYLADGTLVPRAHPQALVTDASDVTARVLRLVADGVVRSIDGTDVPLVAESVCLHSDTPGAERLGLEVRAGLDAAGVDVRSFVG